MRRGRPNGKRSNPEYRQHSLWLPNALHARAARKLITDTGRQEFSVLVSHLLECWLADGAKIPTAVDGVAGDVVKALIGLGATRKDAESTVARVRRDGDTFDSLFRRASATR